MVEIKLCRLHHVSQNMSNFTTLSKSHPNAAQDETNASYSNFSFRMRFNVTKLPNCEISHCLNLCNLWRLRVQRYLIPMYVKSCVQGVMCS